MLFGRTSRQKAVQWLYTSFDGDDDDGDDEDDDDVDNDDDNEDDGDIGEDGVVDDDGVVDGLREWVEGDPGFQLHPRSRSTTALPLAQHLIVWVRISNWKMIIFRTLVWFKVI